MLVMLHKGMASCRRRKLVRQGTRRIAFMPPIFSILVCLLTQPCSALQPSTVQGDAGQFPLGYSTEYLEDAAGEMDINADNIKDILSFARSD